MKNDIPSFLATMALNKARGDGSAAFFDQHAPRVSTKGTQRFSEILLTRRKRRVSPTRPSAISKRGSYRLDTRTRTSSCGRETRTWILMKWIFAKRKGGKGLGGAVVPVDCCLGRHARKRSVCGGEWPVDHSLLK